jgi:transposase InsO family protein
VSLGLSYQVYSSAEVNWVWQDNLDFLQDYLRADDDLVSADATQEIEALVDADPGLSVAQALARLTHATADDLYALLAAGRLYVDLHAVRLADRVHTAIYLDASLAQAHHIMSMPSALPHARLDHLLDVAPNVGINWNGRPWTMVNLGATHITLLSTDGEVCDLPNDALAALFQSGRITRTAVTTSPTISAAGRERIGRASTADREEANRRYAVIAAYLAGEPPPVDRTPERTRRRWLKQWKEAERADGNGYLGLLPGRSRQGNRLPKLPAATLRLQEEFITTHYQTLTQQSMVAVWGLLARACEERGLIPPSYTTFRLAIKHRPRDEQIRHRQGPRAADAHATFYWELPFTLPRHGNRPFAIAHLDHTELDIELVCSQTGRPLGRPWATMLVDAFSRRILALSLSYQPPSTMSCLMALRVCVQRHGRLPQTLVVDGAPEFRSTHFETLLAAYEVTKKTRPWAKPHFGSVCERLIGTTNAQFVHTLVGNTQIMTNVRQVTKSVDPKGQACWTYADFFAHLCHWAYELYDTTPHAALGQSPREAFVQGEQQSGVRAHTWIRDDEDFRLWTLPSTQKGTALVQPGQGVKINYLTYWCEDFRDPQIVRTRVEVRYVPWDASQAYAYVHGHWVACISCYRARFEGHSTTELLRAAEELRQRDRLQARAFPVTARRLAEALVARQEQEAVLLQRRRDAEMRSVLAAIHGGDAIPDADGIPEPAALLERAEGLDDTAPDEENRRPVPFRRFC